MLTRLHRDRYLCRECQISGSTLIYAGLTELGEFAEHIAGFPSRFVRRLRELEQEKVETQSCN